MNSPQLCGFRHKNSINCFAFTSDICNIRHITITGYLNSMSIGKSGRVVLQIDPNLKKQLYGELAIRGLTLKEWFLMSASELLKNPNANVQQITNEENEQNG